MTKSSLPPREVHVWQASLDCGIDSFRRTLSADERSRSDRFHFERDRAHYIAGRGILRRLLGQYLGCPPEDLRFESNKYGKPALTDRALDFNVSHSHGIALFAVTTRAQIGIDVEKVREDFGDYLSFSERFFAPGERAALRALPIEARHRAFFTCWTRKEAYIKARGEGISHPLDAFEVSVSPEDAPAVLKTVDGPMDAANWHLEELVPGGGYVAALAVRGIGFEVRHWQWPHDAVAN